jgi:hypothetical protein
MHVTAWLISVAVCTALLVVAPRYGTGFVIKCAVSAIVGGMILVVLIALALRELKVQPSQGFTTVVHGRYHSDAQHHEPCFPCHGQCSDRVSQALQCRKPASLSDQLRD